MNSKLRICLILLLITNVVLCVAGCMTNASSREGAFNRNTQPSSKQQPSFGHTPTEISVVRFVTEPTEPPSPFDEGSFVDEQHAWIAGFQLKYTSDGGRTWQRIRPSSEGESVFGKIGYTYIKPYFVTLTRGWLKARTGIWQTEDGGQTWRRVFAEGFVPQFADAQHGWINIFTSESTEQSYVTQDGGQTWQACGDSRDMNNQRPSSSSYFLTPQFGWAITSNTVDRQTIYGVARTINGGCSWQQLWISDENPDEWYSDIYFINEYEGWLAGKANGSLYHTTDGGKTWKRMLLPTESTKVISVYFISSKKGWIIAKRMAPKDTEGMFRTINGGETWHKLREREITSGFGANGGISEIPANWKAGRLLQMLYASRANINQVTR